MSGIIDKMKIKADEVLHKDKDTTHTGTHSGVTGNPNTTATGGPHHSHATNTVDPTVHSGNTTGGGLTGHSTTGGYGSHNPSSTVTGGAHSSHAANTIDPTVQSGRSHNGGLTGNSHNGGLTGNTHNQGLDKTTHSHSTANNGPHDSSITNKLDPRVDSSTAGYGNQGGLTGHSTTGHSTGGYGNTANNGPHDSGIANKVDPRVDSTTTSHSTAGGYGNTGHSTANPLTGHSTTGGYGNTGHSTTGGYGNTGHSTTGGYGNTANNGPHDSGISNKIDPRVDSTTSHSTAGGYGNTGHSNGNPLSSHQQTGHTAGAGVYDSSLPGPAPTTAGPHKSNFVNKADPRVDSDLDGSKPVGGNKTFANP